MFHRLPGKPSRRVDVWALRRWLWQHSSSEASRLCMRRATGHGARVVYGGATGKAGLRSVLRCGSVWTCPTCSRAIGSTRVTALSVAVELMREPCMVTLTRWHGSDETLAVVLARAQDGWRRMRQGKRGWSGDYARVMEVTWRPGSGWHVHFHVLAESAGAAGLVARWLEVTGASPDAQHIAPADASGLGEYLAGELLGSHYKGRSQWAMLADAVDGDPRAEWAWEEWEATMPGARQLTWSRGLRSRVKEASPVDPDLTDADALDEAEGDSVLDVPVAHIEALAYAALCARGRLGTLLALTDAHDFASLDDYLARHCGSGYKLAPWVQEWAHIQRAERAKRERLF